MATPAFDPVQYKRTTREQWEDAAEAWHRWGPTSSAGSAPATERMLDAAGVAPGEPRARRRGRRRRADPRRRPAGRPDAAASLATDISPGDPRRTPRPRRAPRPGLTNVETLRARRRGARRAAAGRVRRGDLAGRPDLLPRPAARAGRHAPGAAPRRADRGGRLLHARAQRVLLDAGRRSSAAAPSCRRRCPGQPGPFSLGGARGARGGAAEARASATSTVEAVDAPVRLASAAECVRFERESFGALHQMLSGARRGGARGGVARDRGGPAAVRGRDGFVGPCELLIGSARRP